MGVAFRNISNLALRLTTKTSQLMKFTQISLVFALIALCSLGCKKETISEISSPFIFVEAKNSVLYFHYSHVDSVVSGDSGYVDFSSALSIYDSPHVLATITGGDLGGANNDSVYTSHMDQYGITNLPFFQCNLSTLPIGDAITNHSLTSSVLVNADYELDLTDPSKIVINTTTEFFENAQDSFFLTAYVIVDSIVSNQAGHPDGVATNHRRAIVDVGRVKGFGPQYHGYKVAAGVIEKGYKFNLTFEADRLAAWTDNNLISVALVISKRNPTTNAPIFVNANTQH